MKKQTLRVGFDLDGVLLYNPTRIVRPLVTEAKKLLFRQRKLKFYLPHSLLQKSLWYFLHKSSLFISPGYHEVKQLVKDGKIKAYLITARYSFLQNDLGNWLKKLEAGKYFQGSIYNKNNEQPHLFKEKIIKKLNLDIFVEDNWDIVNYLDSKHEARNPKTKIFWIYNILDRKIDYKYKFPVLKKAVEVIENEIKEKA